MRRIGVDARPLISSKPTGIGNYVKEILKRIPKEERSKFFLYINKEIPQEVDIDLSGFNIRLIAGKIGTLWVCLKLKKYILEDQIDTFWGTEHMLPLNAKNVKNVLSIMDIALMINPRWGSYKNAIMQNFFARISIKKADKILAISVATREDLVMRLHVDPKKVRVTLLGAPYIVKRFFDEDDIKNLYHRLEITEDKKQEIFLYIGTIEPRKNIQTIVKAFNLYCKKYNQNCILILAGGLGWRTTPIINEINKSKYNSKIILPGYITEKEKAILYSKATAFVFPSNYEGFGLPILEAMQYGLPVITSSSSSLPEVGGELAYYLKDTHDYRQLAQLMKYVADLSLDMKQDLAKKEKNWCEKFNWNDCANQTRVEILNTQEIGCKR